MTQTRTPHDTPTCRGTRASAASICSPSLPLLPRLSPNSTAAARCTAAGARIHGSNPAIDTIALGAYPGPARAILICQMQPLAGFVQHAH